LEFEDHQNETNQNKGEAATVDFPRLALAMAGLPMRPGADHSGFDSYPFISIRGSTHS